MVVKKGGGWYRGGAMQAHLYFSGDGEGEKRVPVEINNKDQDFDMLE